MVDLCPQANSSGMLLGGIEVGEQALEYLSSQVPRKTIAGYIEDRIKSPYIDPYTGSNFLTQVHDLNQSIPDNLYLIAGDEQLEIQASLVMAATNPGPTDAWRIVHTWINDLIANVQQSWNTADTTVFIDCSPRAVGAISNA